MELAEHWDEVKSHFRESFRSSFHYAIATVTRDGEPHVTPIGSLILREPCRGFYFEKFPKQLAQNLASNRQVCVLAVNSGGWFWFRSLLGGRFAGPPAVRLHGVTGELRDATDREHAQWQKRVSRVSFTKGHKLIWRAMSRVRDIEFTRIEPVNIGEMTRGIWSLSPPGRR